MKVASEIKGYSFTMLKIAKRHHRLMEKFIRVSGCRGVERSL